MQRTRRQAPPPTVVCLVRHGTTPTTGKVLPGRARGLHLSDAGRAEAARAAEHFRTLEVEAVYASPLERARETAAPIGSASGRRVAIERGLVECDFGEWTGADLSKLRRLPQWKAVQSYPSGFRFPSGESFQELQARLQSTISELCERHAGKAIVAVSHADCIKAVAALALGVPLDLFQRILIGPCSTTVVAYGAEGPAVLTMNSYGVPPGFRTRRGSAA
ncbi:MAG: histidine phosphatase family protein [Acidimicrobiales bacterium]|jgi:probable phosphomutase (TIGR03848 family)